MTVTNHDLTARALEQLAQQREGEQLRTRVNADLVQLQGVPAAAEAIAARYAGDLEAARQLDVERQGTDARDAAIERANDVAGSAQVQLQESAEASMRTLLVWLQEQAAPTGDPTTQLLAETRMSGAWARLRPLLDAGKPVQSLIEQAQERADHVALLALRREFESYAEASSKPVGIPRVICGLLDDAILATAPKEQRAELQLRRAMGDAQESAEIALRNLQGRITGYGSFAKDPRALNRAVRTLDVQAANARPAV